MARFNYITVGFPEGFTAEVKHEHHGYTSDEHSRLIIAEEKKHAEIISQQCFNGSYGIQWQTRINLSPAISRMTKLAATYSIQGHIVNGVECSKNDFMKSVRDTDEDTVDYGFAIDTPFFTLYTKKVRNDRPVIGILSRELLGIKVGQDLFDRTARPKALEVRDRFFEVIRPAILHTIQDNPVRHPAR